MQRDLEEAIDLHNAILAEGNKALIGYGTAKALANVVLLSEIPTTYDKSEQRQVNAGNLLLRASLAYVGQQVGRIVGQQAAEPTNGEVATP